MIKKLLLFLLLLLASLSIGFSPDCELTGSCEDAEDKTDEELVKAAKEDPSLLLEDGNEDLADSFSAEDFAGNEELFENAIAVNPDTVKRFEDNGVNLFNGNRNAMAQYLAQKGDVGTYEGSQLESIGEDGTIVTAGLGSTTFKQDEFKDKGSQVVIDGAEGSLLVDGIPISNSQVNSFSPEGVLKLEDPKAEGTTDGAEDTAETEREVLTVDVASLRETDLPLEITGTVATLDGVEVSGGAEISAKGIDNPNWKADAEATISEMEAELPEGEKLTDAQKAEVWDAKKTTPIYSVDGGTINPKIGFSNSVVEFTKETTIESTLFRGGCMASSESNCYISSATPIDFTVEGNFEFIYKKVVGVESRLYRSEGSISLSTQESVGLYRVGRSSSVTEFEMFRGGEPIVKFSVPEDSYGVLRKLSGSCGNIPNCVYDTFSLQNDESEFSKLELKQRIYDGDNNFFKSNANAGFRAAYFGDNLPETWEIDAEGLSNGAEIYLGKTESLESGVMENYFVVDSSGDIKATSPDIFQGSKLTLDYIDAESHEQSSLLVNSANSAIVDFYPTKPETIWRCSDNPVGSACQIGENIYTKEERDGKSWWVARDGEVFPESGPEVGGRMFNGKWVDENRNECESQSGPCSYSSNIAYFDIAGEEDLTKFGEGVEAKGEYVLPKPEWKFAGAVEGDEEIFNGATYTAELCPKTGGGSDMCWRARDNELFDSKGRFISEDGIWTTRKGISCENNQVPECYSQNSGYFDVAGSPNREYATVDPSVTIHSVSLASYYDYPKSYEFDTTKYAKSMFVEGSEVEVRTDETGREYVSFFNKNLLEVQYDVVEVGDEQLLRYTNDDGSEEFFRGNQKFIKDSEGNLIAAGESTVIGRADISPGTSAYIKMLELPPGEVVSDDSKLAVKNVLGDSVFRGTAEVSSPYGNRRGKLHTGTDFFAPTGTQLYAPADVEITYAGIDPGGGGNSITGEFTARSGAKIEFKMMHLDEILVENKDIVTPGTILAKSGNTGRSTGPHLHYECSINGVQVNPMDKGNSVCFNG